MRFSSRSEIDRLPMKSSVSVLHILTAMAAMTAITAIAALPRTEAPDGVAVYIISPSDGEVVDGKVTVLFGLSGMGIAPAGTQVDKTGHHHLIVDAPLPALDQPIPSDEHYRHFGGGQTEVTIELEPGEHTLQLLLGDWIHVPHEPAIYSDVITIEVR